MSDTGRESLTDKASSAVKPDSEKSVTEKISDSASSTYDSAAKAVQPESEKSTTQKAGDSLSSGSSDASKQGESYLDSAKQGIANAAEGVQNYMSGETK